MNSFKEKDWYYLPNTWLQLTPSSPSTLQIPKINWAHLSIELYLKSTQSWTWSLVLFWSCYSYGITYPGRCEPRLQQQESQWIFVPEKLQVWTHTELSLELSCSGGFLAAVGYCPRALQALGNCGAQHSALKLWCHISCHLLCNTLSQVLWFNTTAMYYLLQFLGSENQTCGSRHIGVSLPLLHNAWGFSQRLEGWGTGIIQRLSHAYAWWMILVEILIGAFSCNAHTGPT